MWHGGAIRLTPSRLVAVAVAGRAPASGDDGSTAAPAVSRVPARFTAVRRNAWLGRLECSLGKA
jgi:hypothetical protein